MRLKYGIISENDKVCDSCMKLTNWLIDWYLCHGNNTKRESSVKSPLFKMLMCRIHWGTFFLLKTHDALDSLSTENPNVFWLSHYRISKYLFSLQQSTWVKEQISAYSGWGSIETKLIKNKEVHSKLQQDKTFWHNTGLRLLKAMNPTEQEDSGGATGGASNDTIEGTSSGTGSENRIFFSFFTWSFICYSCNSWYIRNAKFTDQLMNKEINKRIFCK